MILDKSIFFAVFLRDKKNDEHLSLALADAAIRKSGKEVDPEVKC